MIFARFRTLERQEMKTVLKDIKILVQHFAQSPNFTNFAPPLMRGYPKRIMMPAISW